MPDKYKYLKYWFESLDCTSFMPSNEEMEEIIYYAKKEIDFKNNVGFRHERTLYNNGDNNEKIFSDEWIKENEPKPWLNHGNGILQDLFITSNNLNPISRKEMVVEINKRDRMIVATVIQWLGSNVGFCFLQRTLKKCGYELKKNIK